MLALRNIAMRTSRLSAAGRTTLAVPVARVAATIACLPTTITAAPPLSPILALAFSCITWLAN
jgi:hypothetical protein